MPLVSPGHRRDCAQTYSQYHKTQLLASGSWMLWAQHRTQPHGLACGRAGLLECIALPRTFQFYKWINSSCCCCLYKAVWVELSVTCIQKSPDVFNLLHSRGKQVTTRQRKQVQKEEEKVTGCRRRARQWRDRNGWPWSQETWPQVPNLSILSRVILGKQQALWTPVSLSVKCKTGIFFKSQGCGENSGKYKLEHALYSI